MCIHPPVFAFKINFKQNTKKKTLYSFMNKDDVQETLAPLK